MTISATMILDSVSPNRIRLMTLQLRYPRYIHSELMTHRVFSRNASSSRAIPVQRLIKDVIDDPVNPPKWFANRAGMQGGSEITGKDAKRLQDIWNEGRERAIETAREMCAVGAHKQHINRVLEPYCHINVVVSSTRWANWEALRDHGDAHPEIQSLARAIKAAIAGSKPGLLQSGQWHMPYVTPTDWMLVNEGGDSWTKDHVKTLIKISVARCARVSYMTYEGRKPSITEDLKLYETLVGSQPLHASPAEHQATPDSILGEGDEQMWANGALHANLGGWIQYRKTLKGENVPDAPYVLPDEQVSVDLPAESGDNGSN